MTRVRVPVAWLFAVLLALATGESGWTRMVAMPVATVIPGAHAMPHAAPEACPEADCSHDHAAASPCMACLLAHAVALAPHKAAGRRVAPAARSRRESRPPRAGRRSWRPGRSRAPPASAPA